MESGVFGTNGKMAWEQGSQRLALSGETLGSKVILAIQSYPAWRCRSCQLVLLDHSHAL